MKILKITTGLILLILLLLLVAAVIQIAPRIEAFPDQRVPQDLLSDSRFQPANIAAMKLIKSVREEHHLPSLSAAVSVNKQLVWAAAVGYASLADETPITAEHRYRIGKLSESFTAVGLGTLIDRGKLTLDTDFHDVVPDFPAKSHRFTLGQLAGHSAGIKGFRWFPLGLLDRFNQEHYESVSAALTRLKDRTLDFPPGTKTEYSEYGYTLLSRAMEISAGKPFVELMDTAVFKPLKMKSTEADDSEATTVAQPYFIYGESIIRAPAVNNSHRLAGAGFLSTPRDLVALANGLLADKVLKRATREVLWTPQPGGTMNEGGYALGFNSRGDGLNRIVTRAGSGEGSAAYVAIYPEVELVVALAINGVPLTGQLDMAEYSARIAEEYRKLIPEPMDEEEIGDDDTDVEDAAPDPTGNQLR